MRSNQPSALIDKQLVHFVPFLPLEGQHVRHCARVMLQTQRDAGMRLGKWRHLSWDPEVETHLAGKMARYDQFVVSGCKLLEHEAINPIIVHLLGRANPKNRECGLFKRQLCHRHSEHRLHIARCLSDDPPLVVYAIDDGDKHRPVTRERLSPPCQTGYEDALSSLYNQQLKQQQQHPPPSQQPSSRDL